MRHLDDFLVFVWTWTRASGKRRSKEPPAPKEPAVAPPPLLPKDPRPSSERISFFINARVSSVMVDIDLAPLSRVSAHVDNVVAGFCPGSGRYVPLRCYTFATTNYFFSSMEDSSRIGSFVLTFLTGIFHYTIPSLHFSVVYLFYLIIFHVSFRLSPQ